MISLQKQNFKHVERYLLNDEKNKEIQDRITLFTFHQMFSQVI